MTPPPTTTKLSPRQSAEIHAALDQAEILTFAFCPPMRRQGLERKLLDRGFQRLAQDNISVLFLEVAHDNHAARAFYKNVGFVVVGRRHGYYPRTTCRIDADVMRCDL